MCSGVGEDLPVELCLSKMHHRKKRDPRCLAGAAKLVPGRTEADDGMFEKLHRRPQRWDKTTGVTSSRNTGIEGSDNFEEADP
jgi:hypothetical protein